MTEIRAVTLQEMLLAREQRSAKQAEMLRTFHAPLICFTMNIPGPIKTGTDIHAAFLQGIEAIRDSLHNAGIEILSDYISETPAGYEYYAAAQTHSLMKLKQLTTAIEEADRLGRLYDIDILDTDQKKISRSAVGLSPRKCLLCGNDARNCGRSRTHSVAALQAEVQKILDDSLRFF